MARYVAVKDGFIAGMRIKKGTEFEAADKLYKKNNKKSWFVPKKDYIEKPWVPAAVPTTFSQINKEKPKTMIEVMKKEEIITTSEDIKSVFDDNVI